MFGDDQKTVQEMRRSGGEQIKISIVHYTSHSSATADSKKKALVGDSNYAQIGDNIMTFDGCSGGVEVMQVPRSSQWRSQLMMSGFGC
ncbi:uncharacterized protein V6R79_011013 [Siganus canaliculatus]